MNFWWVNHSQTFRHEFFGKYIWSPKRKRNDHINPFYETMREVAPGDVIYSFADGAVQGFGLARTHCYTSPRPDEFGHIGQAWNEVGWRVDIDFQKFTEPILPTQHMQAIGPTLSERYSPIRANGYGNQGVYLAQIPQAMALIIAQLASPELLGIIQGIQVADAAQIQMPDLPGVNEWEEQETKRISEDVTVRFCDRYIDVRSRTHDQMVQAARSGVQNIAEGSQASGTSKKMELKLTNVARASLEELRLDYEDFLRQRGLEMWPPEHPPLKRFKAKRCTTLEQVRLWVEEERRRATPTKKATLTDTDEQGHGRGKHEEPSVPVRESPSSAQLVANAALSLLNLACYFLDRQVAAQAAAFEQEGGFTERLYRTRSQLRRAGAGTPISAIIERKN